MFGSPAKGAHAYAQIGIESGVLSASPHKLVVLLFDGAIVSVSKALVHMKNGDIVEKGNSLNHAITIIDSGLRASLNKTKGGEIAATLESLYAHMSLRILQANLRNKPEILVEVMDLLKSMRESWAAIEPADRPSASPFYADAPRRSQVPSGGYDNQRVTA